MHHTEQAAHKAAAKGAFPRGARMALPGFARQRGFLRLDLAPRRGSGGWDAAVPQV